MQHLAIYDMDKTITAEPTWMRFLIHGARMHAPWRLLLLPVAALAALAYVAELVDRAGLKQFTQRLLLGRAVPPEKMTTIARDFARIEVEHGVLEGARARIAADRAAGYRLVMATASHGYYATEIGHLLGFNDVVATQAQRDGQGRVLSLIEGNNCYGPVKLHMLEIWLNNQELARSDAHIRAYSDHVSDAPLLEWADEPFAVNAHSPLKSLAATRGWPLLDWR